ERKVSHAPLSSDTPELPMTQVDELPVLKYIDRSSYLNGDNLSAVFRDQDHSIGSSSVLSSSSPALSSPPVSAASPSVSLALNESLEPFPSFSAKDRKVIVHLH